MPAPRILVTRSPHQASPLAEALRAAGLDPILIPTIELAPPDSYAPLDEAIANLASYHWLLFTSANAVEAFAQRLLSPPHNSVILSEAQRSRRTPTKLDSPKPPEPFPPHLPPTLLIAAIGPATAQALQLVGTKPTLIPPQAVAESLATALLPHAQQPDGTPTRMLLVRAQEARNTLETQLKNAKVELTIAPAYRTIIPPGSIPAIRNLLSTPANYPDAITFTSSSTATNLLALLEVSGLTFPPSIRRISIGPITSQTLRDLNLPPNAEAAEPTISSLVEKVIQALAHRN